MLGGMRTPDPHHLGEQARKCRVLAIEPDVVEQITNMVRRAC
jgi:hypothetical protein